MVTPCRFTDASGSSDGTLSNDGSTLVLTVRGVAFRGGSLDDFEPVGDSEPSGFRLHRGDLCAFRLDGVLPVRVTVGGRIQEGAVRFRLELGEPAPNGGLDRETVQLTLVVGERSWSSPGTAGHFEDELLAIVGQLPPDVALRSCLACGLSDYSPLGNGLFGTLYCFRDTPAAYRQVSSKDELFELWDDSAGPVQETWHCDDWEPRQPGAGYRG